MAAAASGFVAVPPPPPVSVEPWQYELHVEPFHAVPAASPVNAIVAGSGWSMWPTEFTLAGTVWHVPQAMSAWNGEPVARCFWCAPTPRSVVELPVLLESNGGAFLGSLFEAAAVP